MRLFILFPLIFMSSHRSGVFSLLKIPPLLAAPHENLTRDLSSSSSFTFELKKEKKKGDGQEKKPAAQKYNLRSQREKKVSSSS
jgi:hypothetical protein